MSGYNFMKSQVIFLNILSFEIKAGSSDLGQCEVESVAYALCHFRFGVPPKHEHTLKILWKNLRNQDISIFWAMEENAEKCKGGRSSKGMLKRSRNEEDISCIEATENTIVVKKTTKVESDSSSVMFQPVSIVKQPIFSLPKRMGMLRIGTSGYIYKHWKGVVYPPEIPHKRWFEHYCQMFDTLEINNTFYRLPSAEVFDSWHHQAPEGFCYALKFSRFGTHMKRLKDPEQPLSLFIDRAERLGNHLLGPILVQLPPKFEVNVERLSQFLHCAPKQYRWTIEFRDSSWFCEEVYSLLQAHNASLCIHDHEDIPEEHPQVVTADWIYLRFHGKNYQHCYTSQQLKAHGSWIQEKIAEGKDVYAYFNNDYGGYAVENAIELRDLIKSG